jgi:hypothetical protein
MAKWVKLPDGAQVTMSREEYEGTQGMSIFGKVFIVFAVLGVLWLIGHGNGDSPASPADSPSPQHTTSAPVRH